MAMAVGEKAEGEPMSEINTTPLIDVMLVLLIMLIVALPPQRHAVKLDSPRPNPNPPPPTEDVIEPIRVDVDFDGTYYWNGEAISRQEMENRFTVEARRAKQAEVHIQPHKLARYKWVAAVMASAQRIGMTKLGVIGGTQ